MKAALSPLDLELAAYSASELAELSDTIFILLDAADDGTASYLAVCAKIKEAFSRAAVRRLEGAGGGNAVQLAPGL